MGDTDPFKQGEKLFDIGFGKIVERVWAADPFLVHFVHQGLKGIKVLIVRALGKRPEGIKKDDLVTGGYY